MQIELDQHRCVGAGQCVMAAPEVFDQREDDGIAFLIDDDPAEDQADPVREAAAVCPAMAITVRP